MSYQLPSVEVHAGEFTIVRLSNMNVERLALVDVSSTICSHLQDSLLRDLPDCFIELLQICRDSFNILRKKSGARSPMKRSEQTHLSLQLNFYLYGAVLSNQLVLHVLVPQTSFCEVLEQVRVYYLQDSNKRKGESLCHKYNNPEAESSKISCRRLIIVENRWCGYECRWPKLLQNRVTAGR